MHECLLNRQGCRVICNAMTSAGQADHSAMKGKLPEILYRWNALPTSIRASRSHDVLSSIKSHLLTYTLLNATYYSLMHLGSHVIVFVSMPTFTSINLILFAIDTYSLSPLFLSLLYASALFWVPCKVASWLKASPGEIRFPIQILRMVLRCDSYSRSQRISGFHTFVW